MKILKRNQLIILVISLILVTAGYISYTNNNYVNEISASTVALTNDEELGDAKLVSSTISNSVVTTSEENIIKTSTPVEENKEDDFFAISKLGRDTMYSQMLETYQKIYQDEAVPQDQKGIALTEINNIGKAKNSIMIAENLILAKGFENVVIFVNNESISVIIRKDEQLLAEEIAQIQNIVAREINSNIEKIHISVK